jgi:hypothetical protein
MARTVNFSRRAGKIKSAIDELVTEMTHARPIVIPTKDKVKLSEINFDTLELKALMKIQAHLSRVIYEKSKAKK